MMDKETYKRELVRMWDSLRTEYIGRDSCLGVKCEECPLHENGNHCAGIKSAFEAIATVEKWSEEHPKGKYEKHELSEIEHEVLTNELKHLRKTLTLRELVFDNYTFAFSASRLLSKLIKLGYYEGASDDTCIEYYLKNCEVVEHDKTLKEREHFEKDKDI